MSTREFYYYRIVIITSTFWKCPGRVVVLDLLVAGWLHFAVRATGRSEPRRAFSGLAKRLPQRSKIEGD
jgi:hypothetical protein